ncbi:MAG: hypothetical protein ACRDRW_14340 [Pseudonocardiaceae bacterium]
MRSVIRSGPLGYRTSQDPLCQMLGKVLVDGVRGGAVGVGSVAFRACVALFGLLVDHPVDQWGRCRSCRRPGSVFGWRWRQCRVRGKATLCLRQLDEVLLLSLLAELGLAEELGLGDAPPPAAPGPARR